MDRSGHGVGSRIKLKYTRAMIDAIHHGDFESVSFTKDEAFGFEIPQTCPEVPPEVLNPKSTWADKESFETTKAKLIGLFNENFKKFEAGVNADILKPDPGPDFTPANLKNPLPF